MKKKKLKLSPVKLVALAFLIVILIGTFLLTLPISSQERVWTGFLTAIFTATSATCVTGLVVVNTAAYWSLFGKGVIIVLIQIGGLGTMTIITAIFVFFKKQVSLQDSRTMMESVGGFSFGGIKGLLKRIFLGTMIFEGAGACLLATQFIPLYGVGTGILKSLFHAVSAFCNAGFDTLGDNSLVDFALNPVINFTIMALIVIGGLGFIVWADLAECRFNFKKMSFHTKIVLCTSGALLIGGAALFYAFDYNEAFSGMTWYQTIMASLFQSVTTRTAGFASVDQGTLSTAGSLLSMVLMLIGGSPGSTAGGMKTTTIAVLVISAFTYGKKESTVFKHRLEDSTIRQASAVCMIYLAAVVAGTLIICAADPYPIRETLYEVTSALGTVGTTMGITPLLNAPAKIILALFMYTGRIGGLTIAIILSERKGAPPVGRPAGKLLIG